MHQLIVHYVSDSMFACGYINYMHNIMQEYEHIFITRSSLKIDCINKQANIIQISKDWEVITNKAIRKVIYNCDKLIISGIFSKASYISIIYKSLFGKTYLQFWGGDFYSIRDNDKCSIRNGLAIWFKKKTTNIIKKICIRRCTAIITLIEDDYYELEKITGICKRHYAASVPDDGVGGMPVLKIKTKTYPIVILLGNSATETNHHIEALDMLKKYSEEKITILCPLSYGSKEYSVKVIEYGKMLFGSKFVPIVNLIPKDEYLKLLSNVGIAVFNNDRQQGMGNISRLIATGCKVYLRVDTSMWSFYSKRGYLVNDISSISEASFEEFVLFPNASASNNNKIFRKYSDPSILYNSWKNVFDDR